MRSDKEIVADGIRVMDKYIADGWTYNWYTMFNEDMKQLCMGGALAGSELGWCPLMPSASEAAKLCHIAYDAHGMGGRWSISHTDYPALRSALINKYGLGELIDGN